MKYLKQYKKFFNESLNIKKIDEDIFKTLNHYDKYGIQIYKGINYNNKLNTFIVDPIKNEREPKGNMYNIINFNKKWNKYYRLNSIIGTTNLYTAINFGINVYKIIPLKDEIYICPSEDFNYSQTWKYFHEKLSDQRPSLFLGSIICIINMFIENIGLFNNNKAISLFNKNYDKILKLNFNPRTFEKDSAEKGYPFDVSQLAIDIMRNLKDYNSITDMINDLFDPNKNGFKKMKYSDFQKSDKYKDNEVWFHSKCVFKKIHV